MKKIIAILVLSFTIAALMISSVSASEYDAKLDIEYEVNSAGNIVVTASLNSITVENGICDCEYDIKYNDSDLKLVDFTVNVPEKWKADFDKGNVEDLSHKNNNGIFSWAIFSITPMQGITEDEQLYIVLEFEPLNKNSTEIQFIPELVLTDVPIEMNGEVMYDVGSISVNAAKISIDLDDVDTPDIDVNVSVPENSIVPPHTSIGIDEITSGNGVENSQTHGIGMPNVNQSTMVDDSNDSNALWIVIIIIVVLVCVGAAVYVVIISKSKGDKND